MSQTFKEKVLQDADRESRIVAFLGAMPNDMTPDEMEGVLISIVGAHMPKAMYEELLPNFFLYLGLKLKGLDLPDDADITTH